MNIECIICLGIALWNLLMQLENNPVALVTGASRGIGAEIAKSLSMAGAYTILIGRDKLLLESNVAEIKRLGFESEYFVSDVTDYEALSHFIDKIDKIDILVNNAGTVLVKKFTEYTEDDFDFLCNVNIKAYFFLSQYVGKKMIKNKRASTGNIINISSIMGKRAAPVSTPRPQALYTVSKHAIEGLTKALSVELAEYNIRVNSICPTYVITDLTKQLIENETVKNFMLNNIPLKRFATVRDVANAVLFLCSPMANMITGDSLMVDGGWIAS